MESTFDLLEKEIEKGIIGDNESISIGLDRLGKYASIRKRILTLLFSTTGAGKSAMIDTIIINACDNLMNCKSKKSAQFILFSTERNKILRIAKWLSHIIFLKEGVEIQVPKILGWWDEKLNKTELALIKDQKSYIEQVLNDYVIIHEGAKNPMAFYKIMKDYLESVGTYDKTKYGQIYLPNEENKIVVPIIDHGNLTKTTKDLPSKKQAVDKLVEFMQEFRDLEGCSPFWVSQVNRSISGVSRLKDGEHELVLEDVKESSDIGDASDIAISIFDPLKYNQSSKTGYNPSDFLDRKTGVNYFRSAQILKSTYGQDSLRIPLGFNGFCGQFKELPKRDSLSEQEYKKLIDSIITKEYFKNKIPNYKPIDANNFHKIN